MNKFELINYLKSVCAAERGIEFCRNAISTIDDEINGLQAFEPTQHTYQDYRNSARSASAKANEKVSDTGSLIRIIVAGFFFVLSIREIPGILGVLAGLFLGFIFWIVASIVITPVTTAVNYSNTRAVQQNLYEAGKEEYRIAMERYQARITLNQRIRDRLTRRRQDLVIRQKRLECRAQTLYDMGILYAPFRNPTAASQILSYLEMGISDGLEGNSGAYAQYMQDVRVGRICNELTQLRNEIRAGFCRFENIIVGEMRAMQKQLDDYSSSFRDDMNRIVARIDSTSENIGKVTERIMDNLDTLSSSTKSMAWNQYVDQCENLADIFKYRQPW